MSLFNFYMRLNGDKTLLPLCAMSVNQGENKTTRLKFIIPPQFAAYDYTLEMDNGTNKFATDILQSIEDSEYFLVLYYDLESGALARSGKMTLQLVARDKTDNTLCFKSQKSSQSVLFVTDALCANQNSYVAQDINAKMLDALKETKDFKEVLTQSISQANQSSLLALDIASQLARDKAEGVFKGDKGNKGDKGDTGENGAQGATGSKGDKGDKGDKGNTGSKGDKGEDGQSCYLHIAYASSLDSGVLLVYPDKYIGLCSSHSSLPPVDFESYTWYKYKGEKGDTGEDGAQGETGSKGDKGDKGNKGDKGDKGDTGENGAQGETGSKGDKGDKGDNGEYPPLVYAQRAVVSSGQSYVAEVLDDDILSSSFVEVFAANEDTQSAFTTLLLSRYAYSFEGGFYLSFSGLPNQDVCFYYRVTQIAV